jgi:hypothetical protein
VSRSGHRTPGPQLGNTGISGLVLLWDEPLFGSQRPLRIFSQRVGAPLSPSLLWTDYWYSGLVSRTLAPFWRKERKLIPPSFLFVPAEGPFPAGFAILPFEGGKPLEWASRLFDTVAGLGVTPVVLDSDSLDEELKPSVPQVSRNLLDRHGIRLYVSDPSSRPATREVLSSLLESVS